jgi:uncharacterized membrane protein YoaK (UPF0700 family)
MALVPRGRLRPPRFIVGLYMVTFLCGILDAACFLGLGHVFAEIMTGNLVYLTFALGSAGTNAGVPVGPYVAVLAAFGVGAVVGGRLLHLPPALAVRRIGFAVEWLLLLGAVVATLVTHPTAISGSRYLVICLLAGAMGVQNAMVWHWGVRDLATNVMTLTLTALLADSPVAGGKGERTGRRATSIAIFAVSALLGAYLVRFGVVWDLAIALLVLTLALPSLLQPASEQAVADRRQAAASLALATEQAERAAEN